MYLQSISIPSQRLKISADDTTPDFLASKLLAGTGVSLTVANETLTVANTDTGSAAVSSHLSAFSHAPLSQAASSSNNGYLSSSDWSAFNGKFTLPSLTSGSVLFSNGTTIAQDNTNLWWNTTTKQLTVGGLISASGASLGYQATTTPNGGAILKNFWFPRTANFSGFCFLDYLDEAYYWDYRGATTTITPSSDYGSISSLYRSDPNYIAWTSGSSISPIVIEIDATAKPIIANANGTYQVGITFRSSSGVVSYVKIEAWNHVSAEYVTVVDEATSIAGQVQWLSKLFTSPSSTFNIYKLKITLTTTNPIPSTFRIQQIQLYHGTAEFDPWHLHVKGGEVFGSVSFATKTGNVGIGLSSPLRRMDILDTTNPQLRLTHTAGSVYAEMQATSDGYLEINATGNRILLGKDDSDKTFWGAGYDMSVYYNGTDGYLKTDEVAASDLHLTTGVAKTLVYDTAVYEDLNFDPSSSGGAAVTLPDYVTINNCIYREFTSANNQLCGDGEELPHSYKLSSTLFPHVHCFLKSGESAGTTGVTFTLYWALRQAGGVTSGTVTLSATSTELTNNANKFNINDATGFAGASELGGQLSLTLARTGGNAGDVVVTSYGVHYAIDTPGSRTSSTK